MEQLARADRLATISQPGAKVDFADMAEFVEAAATSAMLDISDRLDISARVAIAEVADRSVVRSAMMVRQQLTPITMVIINQAVDVLKLEPITQRPHRLHQHNMFKRQWVPMDGQFRSLRSQQPICHLLKT